MKCCDTEDVPWNNLAAEERGGTEKISNELAVEADMCTWGFIRVFFDFCLLL